MIGEGRGLGCMWVRGCVLEMGLGLGMGVDVDERGDGMVFGFGGDAIGRVG